MPNGACIKKGLTVPRWRGGGFILKDKRDTPIYDIISYDIIASGIVSCDSISHCVISYGDMIPYANDMILDDFQYSRGASVWRLLELRC